MAECCQEALNDTKVSEQPLARPIEEDSPDKMEFDFIERPSEEFFCPVTLELLLDPQQTRCCGNHLSEKVVLHLQRDGKSCPMCKNPQLDTVPDKFHGRKVKAVCVRCPHKVNGCEWEGEVGGLQQHVDSCPKRSWKCQYCKFASTYDVQANHEEQCTHYPLLCPNKCEIGTVPRCDMEDHCKKCPLELVPCDYADVGCDVKIPRRDLRKHMEESEQQHILSATFLNLRLSRETIAKKDRQLAEKDHQLIETLAEKDHQLTEKDRLLAEKDRQLAEKDRLLADKDRQVTEVFAKKDHQLAEKDHQLTEKDHQLTDKDEIIKRKDEIIASKEKQVIELQKQIKSLQASVNHVKVGVDHLCGGMKHCQLFTINDVSKLDEWFSEPFYSHQNGFKLRLFVKNVSTVFAAAFSSLLFLSLASKRSKQGLISKYANMGVGLVLCKGDHDHQLSWPVTFFVDLQLLAQMKQTEHIQQSYKYFFLKQCEGQEDNHSENRHFASSSVLYPEREEGSPYVKNDSMELRLWVHI